VYYNGEWGTVCDNKWDRNKAKMICMQVGIGTLGIPTNFGQGSGRILLDNVICSENDTVLTSCGHYGVGIVQNCDHSKDVGVKCYGMTKLFYQLLATYFLT